MKVILTMGMCGNKEIKYCWRCGRELIWVFKVKERMYDEYTGQPYARNIGGFDCPSWWCRQLKVQDP